MGFGFNFLFILILLPCTVILVQVYLFTQKKIFLKILVVGWICIGVFVLFSLAINWIFTKKELTKSDYYGSYIIDRNFFKGEQADWQYNNFRFEIRENDSLYFYVTENQEIIKTFTYQINTTTPFSSARLIINIDEPHHHVISTNPTTYRGTWDFYLVLYSPKFNNMLFRKGEWKELE